MHSQALQAGRFQASVGCFQLGKNIAVDAGVNGYNSYNKKVYFKVNVKNVLLTVQPFLLQSLYVVLQVCQNHLTAQSCSWTLASLYFKSIILSTSAHINLFTCIYRGSELAVLFPELCTVMSVGGEAENAVLQILQNTFIKL